MAVTTTPQDIVTAAYAKSAKNRPGTIATDATELLQVVIRAMRGLYAFAARVNPIFFSSSSIVAFAGSGWLRPEGAESVFRIQSSDTGAEIVVVPFDDRGAEPSLPAVYALGQTYYPATLTLPNPQSGNLTFFYADRPTTPANLSPATLDARWTEQFNELLILEVSLYLALKDGRMDEVAAFQPMRDAWADLFAAFLEHISANERRRFGNVRRFNINTLVPLKNLLAGGGA